MLVWNRLTSFGRPSAKIGRSNQTTAQCLLQVAVAGQMLWKKSVSGPLQQSVNNQDRPHSLARNHPGLDRDAEADQAAAPISGCGLQV